MPHWVRDRNAKPNEIWPFTECPGNFVDKGEFIGFTDLDFDRVSAVIYPFGHVGHKEMTFVRAVYSRSQCDVDPSHKIVDLLRIERESGLHKTVEHHLKGGHVAIETVR